MRRAPSGKRDVWTKRSRRKVDDGKIVEIYFSFPMFGMGQVAELMDTGQRTRVIVDFARHGRKTLILEHANLQVLG